MKKDIMIIVAVLMILTFSVRLGSFAKKHPLSYDETVYATLAVSLQNGLSDYNTIPLYEDALKKGRKLPPYFNKPLFKHPPLFPGLISLAYNMFGRTYFTAFKVSLLFGVMLIGLAYMLGRTLFDEKTGLISAFLMAIEPMNWIISQKIWMETTLSFFTVLAVCLFALAVKKDKGYLMIASGIAAGCAALTKYPGILATAIIFTYAAVADRKLFRDKFFLTGLFMPLVMLVPWFKWNYDVYGPQMFSSNVEIVSAVSKVAGLLGKYWYLLVGALAAIAGAVTVKKRSPGIYRDLSARFGRVIVNISAVLAVCALIFILRRHILNAFDLTFVPEFGWRMGMFAAEPWYFYLGRVIELSPFYLLSYAGLLLFIFDRENVKEYALLSVSAVVVISFYILWGSFQCRYILAAAVPMMVMAARAQAYALDKATALENRSLKYAGQIIVLIAAAYAIVKTLRIDIAMAVPNMACYF